jgi:hypothetical protein
VETAGAFKYMPPSFRQGIYPKFMLHFLFLLLIFLVLLLLLSSSCFNFLLLLHKKDKLFFELLFGSAACRPQDVPPRRAEASKNACGK